MLPHATTDCSNLLSRQSDEQYTAITYGRSDLLPPVTTYAGSDLPSRLSAEYTCQEIRPHRPTARTYRRSHLLLFSYGRQDQLSSATTVAQTYSLPQRHAARVASHPNKRVRRTVFGHDSLPHLLPSATTRDSCPILSQRASQTYCLRPRQTLKPTAFCSDTRLVSHPIPTSESDVLSSATTVAQTYCILQRHATRAPSHPNERASDHRTNTCSTSIHPKPSGEAGKEKSRKIYTSFLMFRLVLRQRRILTFSDENKKPKKQKTRNVHIHMSPGTQGTQTNDVSPHPSSKIPLLNGEHPLIARSPTLKLL